MRAQAVYPPPGAGPQGIAFRGTTCQTTNTGTLTYTWPTGTVAGDSVVLFVAGQNGVSVPYASGWDALQSVESAANWSKGEAMYKVMTGTDITNGSIAVALGGTGGAVGCGITFVGTVAGIREIDFNYANASTASVGTTTSAQVLASDLAIIFGSARASGNPTSNVGTLGSAANNASNAAGSIYTYTPSAGSFTGTVSYTGYNTAGYYQAIVVIERVSSVPPPNVWYDQGCITKSPCASPADNTNLTTWADRSDNNNTATVATGTATFHTNQINGTGAVTCSSCGLTWASTVSGAPGQWTIFAVFKNAATGSKYSLTACSGMVQACIKYWTGTTKQQGIDSSDLSGGPGGNANQDTNWHQTNVQWSSVAPGNYVFRIDRAADGNGSVGTSITNSNGSILYDTRSGAEFLNGQLAEFIFYAGYVLSNQQRGQVEAYFQTKYGL